MQDNIAIHTQLTVPAMVPAVDHIAASIERPLSSLFLPASAGKAGKRVTRGLVVVLLVVTHLLLKHVKSM